MTANQNLELYALAGNTLQYLEAKDLAAPDLFDLTGLGAQGFATSSGLNDHDYQNLSSLSLGIKPLHQLQHVNKIPIPSEILEHFNHVKCNCLMGLFPEIGRAWLTIDSEIYIWTFESTRDVAFYDGLSHLIIGVGLVKPKPGVFINDVKYLLILTTPIEIIILGVTFSDNTKIISSPTRSKAGGIGAFEEMQLMSKPIFVLPTDNVAFRVIKGTDNGRIFLGSHDGCLYEISYQAESSWFGKRCKKVNHSQSIVSYIVPGIFKVFSEADSIAQIAVDNSRRLLYTLTEKGVIEVWNMGEDCNQMERITKVTQSEVTNKAQNVIKTVEPAILKNVKAICALTLEDSHHFNLIAVTSCGVRLYFSTSAPKLNQPHVDVQQQQQQQQQEQLAQQHNLSTSGRISPLATQMAPAPTACNKPSGLYLLHVRLPPGHTPNALTNKPRQVHTAHYNEGTLLLVSMPQQDQDLLWSISSAPFPNRNYLTESTTVLTLDGNVWGLAEVPDRSKANYPSLLRKAQVPKRIVLLTNHGAHIVALLKPVGILQQLLMACQGPQHDAVRSYFQAQGEREGCIGCLLIACSEQYRGTDLAMWAVQAFMLYGGEPMFQQHSMLMAGGTANRGNTTVDRMSPQMFVSTPMPNTMNSPLMSRTLQHVPQSPQYPLSPIYQQGNSFGGGARTATMPEFPCFVFSAKHDALYLYVARLLRPIWQLCCVNQQLCSTLSQEDCCIILEDLFALRSFLDSNAISEISNGMRSYGSQMNTLNKNYTNTFMPNTTLGTQTLAPQEQRNLNEQAKLEEKRSLTALNQLLKHISEVIGLWKILGEHQFQVLAEQLSYDDKLKLLSCTFRDLTLASTDICTMLIVALINSYLNDCASVSAISAKLRDVCPNLYRHEDAVTFKASEILMFAKNSPHNEERQEKLTTALQLCKDAAPHLPLPNICHQFVLVEFYEGVIELASTCAAKLDPEQLGIHYYNSDEPVEDHEGYAAFTARMTCYQEVRLMLDSIYQRMSDETLENGCVEKKPKTSPRAQINRVLNMSMQINDPLLHMTVYEWMLTHEMRSELLSLTHPTLGEFLRRNVMRNTENLDIIDLLWKYYEKNGHHAKAARILDNLACNKSEAINLEQRIEYLARAVMCMRNAAVGYSQANGMLLKELEDKLEIARVQKTVLNAMSVLAANNRNAANAVTELNHTLYDITNLYKNFAEPYDLWECKLTILNCSHHNDPLLIESVWTQIINSAIEITGSINERCTRLFSKIECLVKEFGESGNCFPLAFLIRELEIKACHLRFPEGIVPEKLVAMQMDVELLLEYYARMISMNERIWTNEGNEWHLVQSAIRLVTLLVNSSSTLLYRSKRRIMGKAQDIVSMCLNLCYQKPDTERLQQSLKELQCRLQRTLA